MAEILSYKIIQGSGENNRCVVELSLDGGKVLVLGFESLIVLQGIVFEALEISVGDN